MVGWGDRGTRLGHQLCSALRIITPLSPWRVSLQCPNTQHYPWSLRVSCHGSASLGAWEVCRMREWVWERNKHLVASVLWDSDLGQSGASSGPLSQPQISCLLCLSFERRVIQKITPAFFFKYFFSTPLLKDKRKKKKRVFLVYKNLAISTFFSEPCFQCSSWSWIQTTTYSERRRFWHQVNVTYPVTGNFRHSQKYREQSHFYDMDI